MRKKATALKYNSKSGDSAPKLMAKGGGLIAERIIATAEKHGVSIKEDPDLVEALSKLEIHQEIPEALYTAVSQLLAEIYLINKRAGSKMVGG